MIAKTGKEAIARRAITVGAEVGIDEFMIELADIYVDRRGGPVPVIVIAEGEDEVRVPAFDEVGYGQFVRGKRRAFSRPSKIADDTQDDGLCTDASRAQAEAENDREHYLRTSRPERMKVKSKCAHVGDKFICLHAAE